MHLLGMRLWSLRWVNMLQDRTLSLMNQMKMAAMRPLLCSPVPCQANLLQQISVSSAHISKITIHRDIQSVKLRIRLQNLPRIMVHLTMTATSPKTTQIWGELLGLIWLLMQKWIHRQSRHLSYGGRRRCSPTSQAERFSSSRSTRRNWHRILQEDLPPRNEA